MQKQEPSFKHFYNCCSWLHVWLNWKAILRKSNMEFTIGPRERERQSENAYFGSRHRSRFKSLRCNNWNAKNEMARIISKSKQTWQEQVLIELCCWMCIAQKQSVTSNLFYFMSIRVQICNYHIGNMTAFH